MEQEVINHGLIQNDAVILGILLVMLAFVFNTASSDHPVWKKFYSIVPMLVVCYFLPSLLNTFGLVNAEESNLYFVVTRYLLPSCLVLLTLSIDFKEIIRLGPKALIMFATGTVGVIIGGPLSIYLVSFIDPDIVGGSGPDAVWRGMTTIAGSWIGGGANQTAMKELFEPSNDLFSTMVTIDIIVAEIWMVVLILGIGKSEKIDRYFKADASAINSLKQKMETFAKSIARVPTTNELMSMLGICFGATAIAHLVGDNLAPWLQENAPYLEKYSLTSGFFWIVVISTTIGFILSFTRFRNLEGAGASKIGTVFIYILVAVIGLNMNVLAIFDNLGLFMVGLIWMSIHVILLFIVAKLIRAPYFFLAVGSKANIGGAASAPVVAGAFHPSLAPVGVLLAVLGYAMGTYGAWLCGILMQIASK